MVAPLPRLAVGLATVVQLPQQLADHALADLEAKRGQLLDEVTLTAADPAQRRAGIAANGVLDQFLQRRRQPGLPGHRALAASAGPAQPGAQFIATAPQFRNASLDRAARQPGCARGRGDAARALRQRFVGGEQSPGAFIEEDRCFPPTRADVGDVDHTATLADASRVAPSKFSDSIRALLAAPRFVYFAASPKGTALQNKATARRPLAGRGAQCRAFSRGKLRKRVGVRRLCGAACASPGGR